MKLHGKFFFLICVLLLASGCSTTSNDFDFASKEYSSNPLEFNRTFVLNSFKVVGIGDSLTQGVGDEKKLGGYFGRVTSTLSEMKGVASIKPVNAGKRGRRSDQLVTYLQSPEGKEAVQDSSMIFMTIGGNDVMKIVKGNIFHLKTAYFEEELPLFMERYRQIVEEVRKTNPTAPIIFIGIYNPFSIVTDQKNEFQEIVKQWNLGMESVAKSDVNGCFVSIEDLFQSDSKLVYHTDFFHPNSRGYDDITEAIMDKVEICGLEDLTNGEMQIRR